MKRQVRIGIDVGGTFTDAVIIDNDTFEIIAKRKILTTHKEGVAKGVVDLIHALMSEQGISPDSVAFIAHGTTQATNALLEGDVAVTGILGMAKSGDVQSARRETDIPPIKLCEGKTLKTCFTFIKSTDLSKNSINKEIDNLLRSGAKVIVASEAFGVDDPKNERMVVEVAREKGVCATGGHEISELYGLRIRTRTAVINASIIPKMMETANMTESAVKKAGISKDLMIMRCDGGVMNLDQMRKRPILTILSGPAAGVAGALMYEHVSDGIFLESGGTSTDISVIRNGRVIVRHAEIGGHKTYLRSLDVRTVGIAGGTMIRVSNRKIGDIGPRSAHIACLKYECFDCDADYENAEIEFISPQPDDPKEYTVIKCKDGRKYALTLAGAANILGFVSENDYACGDLEKAKEAWSVLADYLGMGTAGLARQVLNMALDKVDNVITELISSYDLDRSTLKLVGGGGSAAVLVPALAKRHDFKWSIAKDAPYISTIGVALAMVMEQVERSIVNPSQDDILHIRADVIDKLIRAGAKEETADVVIEIDAQRNILRAVATGATELRMKNLSQKQIHDSQKIIIASEELGVPKESIKICESCGRWTVLESMEEKKGFLGLKKKEQKLCVIDIEGVVRFKHSMTEHNVFSKLQMKDLLKLFIDENTEYSDANATIPNVLLFYHEKMLDLTGIREAKQLIKIAELETKMLDCDENIIAVAYHI